MATVTWNRLALDDLQRIAEYIRETNPLKEQQFLGDIIKKAEQLAQQPRSGQQVANLSTATSEVRTLLVTRSLRLLYQVTPADDVFILQVLDLRSDQPFYR